MSTKPAADRGTEPIVEVVELTKAFNGTVAADKVTLQFWRGAVHSLVGQNGAGKSTVLGMLAGRLTPTSGVIRLAGGEVHSVSPRAARSAGVVAIYQELTIIPTMSAMANVFLAEPKRRAGLLDRTAMRRRYAELAQLVGACVAPDTPARTLSVADQQLLEVMRALHADTKVIIFDEPTAPLALDARTRLLNLMRILRDHGVAVVFVSHHLEEVLEVSDEISVLRDGRVVAHATASGFTKETLIDAMLGSQTADAVRHPAARRRAAVEQGDVVLSARDVTVPGVLDHVSFRLLRGEIVGIAGLVGSGRSTLLRTLAGLERGASGQISIDGIDCGIPRSVRHALRLGIALLPEDRKLLGLIAQMSAADNIVIGRIKHASRYGVLTRRSVRRAAQDVADRFGVRADYLSRSAANLSGGNQQKLLLARSALRGPAVLLADEPTRGIDVGAKKQMRDTLRSMADAGLSIVMVSAEHEELLEIADRLVVLAKGRVTARIDNTSHQAREQDVLRAAFDRESNRVA